MTQNIRNYTPKTIAAMKIAKEEGIVTPFSLFSKSYPKRTTYNHGDAIHVSGYLGKLCGEGLLSRTSLEDGKSAYILTKKGEWSLSMIEHGWSYKGGEWVSKHDRAITSDAADFFFAYWKKTNSLPPN